MKKKRALSNHDTPLPHRPCPTATAHHWFPASIRPCFIDQSTKQFFSQPNTEVSRRSVLQRSALGVGSLGLLNLLQQEPTNAAETQALATSLSSRPAHFVPRAKRVIHFFLNGGPSHVDTFDPKPMLKRFSGQTVSDNPATERKTGQRCHLHFASANTDSRNRSQRAVSADCCAHR